MFTNDPNLIQLSDKIFWYKNFIDQETVNKINEIANNKSKGNHWFEEIQFQVTPEILELKEIWDKVSEFLQPTHVVHPLLSMISFAPGAEMLPHCDSPGEGHDDDLTVPDVWSTCCLLEYGVCIYFGDFTGGEVYYPNQDVTIPVQPGDLVIHGALSDCMHGVKPVETGLRYTFTNFALKPEKNPGTFYNFGTPEYEEHVKDLTSWLMPLKNNDKSVQLDPIKF